MTGEHLVFRYSFVRFVIQSFQDLSEMNVLKNLRKWELKTHLKSRYQKNLKLKIGMQNRTNNIK